MNNTQSQDDAQEDSVPGRPEGAANMATELACMRRLHQLHNLLATATDVQQALVAVVAVACEFTATDRGCLWLVSDDGLRLDKLAWYGHAGDGPFIRMLRDEGLRLGFDKARAQQKRVQVDDWAMVPGLDPAFRFMLDTEGIAASQSTPMISRKGAALGVLSTQFRKSHRASDEQLRMLDMLARAGADFVERHRAESILRWSEQKYRSLFDLVGEGFCITELIRDENGDVADIVFRDANRAFVKQTGLTDPVGKTLRETHPDLEPHWLDAYLRVAETREPFYTENYRAHVDRWYSLHLSPVGDAHGGLIAAVFDDITARKKAELALRENMSRHAFLLQLNDALRPLSDPAAIRAEASRMLGEHLGVNRALYAEIGTRGELDVVERDYVRDVSSLVGRCRLEELGLQLMREARAGHTFVVSDSETDERLSAAERETCIGIDAAALVAVPLLKSDQLAALFVVMQASPRAWTPEEVSLVKDVAQRSWSVVQRGRAEAALRASEARYHAVMEWASDGIWLADRAGNFIEANAAACRMLGYSLEQYRELNIRDLVRQRDASRLQALLETLNNGGESTDIWRIQHADGHYLPLESSQTLTPGGYWQIIGRDVSKRLQIEFDLQQRGDQFMTLLRESPFGVYLVDGSMHIRVANPAACEAAGGAGELVGDDFSHAMHDCWSDDYADDLVRRVQHTLASGEPCVVPEHVEQRGKESRWFSWYIRRTAIPGTGVGVVCYVGNITAEVRARERQKLLLQEINHRVKNTLATVQSIASQTLHNAYTLEEADGALESRLLSLSRAHDVLTREHWDGAPLHEVVENTLAAYPDHAGASRFHVNGVDIRLQANAVVSLSMALHELATNAVKYGALSDEQGYVEIAWDIVGEGGERRFHFCWSEHEGPLVHAPERRGFGSRLIERGLAMEMAAEVHIDFDPNGLRCRIDAPLDEISAQ